ncbi:hypothetical protein P1P75_40480 [Streptomyces sp. ID05-39B]|uniref:hypothetical protein n=1 Tax=Streptomyces sp. ID05-39B TaxID=3028664 RepID=UPI0029B67EA0|nr:hypothetical protein [Streptomyces sp. ID05-39B]MDX3532509.1 hypothetical protein [Streptomyces sp. ID05-39B]
MDTALTGPTEAELATWLTEKVGDQISEDYEAARLLLDTFDLASKTSSSLNNPHQIANCIASTPSRDREGPWAPVYTVQAAKTLYDAYRITRKPADHARLFVDLPMPVVVSRHQCPFCRRFTRADAAQVRDHMTRCWQNQALRCCKTCIHHQDASGTPGSPDEWLESCTNPDGPEYEDYRFPVLHCPLWEARKA